MDKLRILSSSLFSCLVVACSGGSEPAAQAAPPVDLCTTLFDKTMQCGTAEERTLISNRKETTIKGCKERHREPEEEKAELACTLKPNCDDYLTCRRELGTAQLKKEAELALKTGENFERVFDTCKTGDVRDDAAKKLCVDIFKQAIATATRELAPLRDSGALTGSSKCIALQTLAERVSPEEKAAADVVCKEVEAGRRAKEALDVVDSYLKVGVKEVPVECDMALEDLEKLESEWAKTRLKEVAARCIIDLGNTILPAKVKKMLICEYQVEKVYKAVKKYSLSDPTLDPLIAKAAKKCG